MERLIKLNNPIIYVAMAFMVGIIIGQQLLISPTRLLVVLVALILVAISIYVKNTKGLTEVTLIIIIFWGMFWVSINQPIEGPLRQWNQDVIELNGQVQSITGNNKQFIVEVSHINGSPVLIKPKVVTIVPSYISQIHVSWGDRIKVQGRLEETAPRRNPGGFSEKDYWKNNGVAYKLITNQPVAVLENTGGFKAYINTIREKIYANLSRGIPDEERALALGLILGDRSEIDPNLYEKFQRLGVVHIFAVSGLHVGFLVGIYTWVTSILKLPRKFVLLGALIIFGSYGLLTGLTPSVVRASIMAFLTLAVVFNLKYRNFYSILAAAALVILLINPLNIFAVGFQLSFVTTWGLVYLFPVAKKALLFLPEKIANILAVPLAAQLAALPLTIYYFNLFSLWAPLVNIMFVFVIGILVPLLFVSLIIAFPLFVLAQPFFLLTGGILFFLTQVVINFTELLPFSHFYVATPPIAYIGLYYLLLIGCVEIKELKTRISFPIRALGSIVAIIILLILALPSPKPLVYTYLDVGQGDGCVIQTPLNQFIVIDGGPYSNTVYKYLQYLGANKVDLVILSHSHLDHINGLFKVVQEIPTKVLLVPPNVEDCSLMEELKRQALDNSGQVIIGTAGMVLKVPGEIYLSILSPYPQHLYDLDANNGSLVIAAYYQKSKTLFTGDIENKVIERTMPIFFPIDVLKVPHHGSRSSFSPELYAILDPKIAIIQAGRNNRYNHPHPEVVKALEEKGVGIFRNDQQGAIRIKVNKQGLQVLPYLTSYQYKLFL